MTAPDPGSTPEAKAPTSTAAVVAELLPKICGVAGAGTVAVMDVDPSWRLVALLVAAAFFVTIVLPVLQAIGRATSRGVERWIDRRMSGPSPPDAPST